MEWREYHCLFYNYAQFTVYKFLFKSYHVILKLSCYNKKEILLENKLRHNLCLFRLAIKAFKSIFLIIIYGIQCVLIWNSDWSLQK